MMVNPETVPLAVREQMGACGYCKPDRRPRMFVCEYHSGWWDGWEAPQAGCVHVTSDEGTGYCPQAEALARRAEKAEAEAREAIADAVSWRKSVQAVAKREGTDQ